MSYVDLKHLLADLTLEAVRDPEQAGWAPALAAYGTAATLDAPSVPWGILRQRATEKDLSLLVDRGVLEADESRVRLRQRFLPHLPYLQRQSSRLLKALVEVQRLKMLHTAPLALRQGAALFNTGLFFECHELLEETWKATTGPSKNFYHGIVQAAAAFYHYEKRNMHGARTLLQKGRHRLEPYPPVYEGVNLASFRAELKLWAEHFADTEGSKTPRHDPKIEIKGAR